MILCRWAIELVSNGGILLSNLHLICVTLDSVGNYTCHAAQMGKQEEEVFAVAWLDVSGKYKFYCSIDLGYHDKPNIIERICNYDKQNIKIYTELVFNYRNYRNETKFHTLSKHISVKYGHI